MPSPLSFPIYTNDEGKGGRPNDDVVFMIKLLVLQQWYGLSDPQLEREAYDRLSFRHFPGYPTKQREILEALGIDPQEFVVRRKAGWGEEDGSMKGRNGRLETSND